MKPEFTNPWPYAETLPALTENMKLSREELCNLECRFDYNIKCKTNTPSNLDNNDELYRIFGEFIDKDTKFMRQWVRLYTVMHRTYLTNLAKEYLTRKVIDLATWSKGVKDGKRANVLALFVLCIITGTHCFVHLKEHRYWTSLKEMPASHLEFVQRCNIHLLYLGQGVFAEHTLRTNKVSYKFLGIDQPVELDEINPVVIGTLTNDENDTLDKLLELSHISPLNTETSKVKTCTQAKPTGNLEIQSEAIDETSTSKLTPCEETADILAPLNIVPLEPDFTDSDNTLEIDVKSLSPTEMLQTDKPTGDTIKTTVQEKEQASENIVNNTIFVNTDKDCDQSVASVTETVNFSTDAEDTALGHYNLPKATHLADPGPDIETKQNSTSTEDITMEDTIAMEDTIDNWGNMKNIHV